MVNKRFQQALHDLCDPPAREAVSRWVEMKRNVQVKPNPDIYGIDLIVWKEGKPIGCVEVESRNWKNDDGSIFCPYDTIHVPARKRETLGLPNALFFIVTKDFKYGYYTLARVILDWPIVVIKTLSCTKGEHFFDVPIQCFTLVDLEELF